MKMNDGWLLACAAVLMLALETAAASPPGTADDLSVVGEQALGPITDCNSNGIDDATEGPVLYVDADSTDPSPDGMSWATAYTNLQDALAVATCDGGVNFTEIWVANGTYMPDDGFQPDGGPHTPGTGNRSATFQLLTGVELYGGFAGADSVTFPGGETLRDQRDPVANVATLSGDLLANDGADFLNNDENSYHVTTGSGTDTTAILDGFTITAGNANGAFPDDLGAGMLNGAGAPTITDCKFSDNQAADDGGGMHSASGSAPNLTNCEFGGNVAGDRGAGIYSNDSSGGITLTGCRFTENSVGNVGGGIYAFWSRLHMVNCELFENTAPNGGGGLYFNGDAANPGGRPGTVTNCVFVGNQADGNGGAIRVATDGSLTLSGCTLAHNNATVGLVGGIEIRGSVTVANCVLWNNQDIAGTDESAQINTTGPGTAIIDYTCIQGLTGALGGTSNIGSDPLFADADGLDAIPGTVDDDLRLSPGSPCIDAADNDAVPADVLDLDGDMDISEPIPFDLDNNPRFVDDLASADCPQAPGQCGASPVVDMGPYEFFPDCNNNGTLDNDELAADPSADCNSNGLLDECEGLGDVNSNGLPDVCEVNTVWDDGGDRLNWRDAPNWLPDQIPDNPPSIPSRFYFVTIGTPGFPGPFAVDGPIDPVEIETLTLGAVAGTNSLDVRATLTVNQATQIDAGGSIALVGQAAPTVAAVLAGGTVTIASDGELRTAGAGGQNRIIQADLDNAGAIVASDDLDISGTSFVNQASGTVQVGSDIRLSINSTSVIQGGEITVNGGTIAFENTDLVNASVSTNGITLNDGRLEIQGGNGTVTNQAGARIGGSIGRIFADVINEGTMDFNINFLLVGDLTVLGNGTLTVDGVFDITGGTNAAFVADGGTLSLAPLGAAAVQSVQGNTLDVRNSGTFEAGGNTTISLAQDLTIETGGTYRGVGSSAAVLTAANINISSTADSAGQLLLSGSMRVTSAGRVLISCGTGAFQRGGCTPPTLVVGDAARVDIGGSLELIGASSVSVGTNGTVNLAGNLDNQSTDPTIFNWDTGPLTMNGAGPAQSLEAAGEDFGADLAGFVDNFAMGKLELTAASVVNIVDTFDNQSDGNTICDEALYVGDLVLQAGAVFNTTGCRVYYRNLNNSGGSIPDLGTDVLNVATGDFDDNGLIELADHAALVDCMSGPGLPPDPTPPATVQKCLDRFDADHDGDLDAADFSAWQNKLPSS